MLLRLYLLRWNSSFDMLQRLLEQTPAVHATLLDKSVKGPDSNNVYTFDDQQIIESMLQFLEPFKEATVKLSCEDKPSLPAVYPTYLKLKLALTNDDTDKESIKEMKAAALNDLRSRQ